ncbi:MAG: hypothetical protein LBV21_02980, partial [Candidatus Adiutrix sp.]|nr:hypothetical protein [Candidatus Adiutrix sp.]
MKKFRPAVAAALAFLAAEGGFSAGAAYLNPDPVTLPIANIEQETNYWCWAAIVGQLLARPT